MSLNRNTHGDHVRLSKVPLVALCLLASGTLFAIALFPFRLGELALSRGRDLALLILSTLMLISGNAIAAFFFYRITKLWFPSGRTLLITWWISWLCLCLVLAGLWGQVVWKLTESDSEDIKLMRTKNDIFILTTAISAFEKCYGRWPCTYNGQTDVTYGPGSQAELVAILSGKDKTKNPRGLIFVDEHSLSVKNGEICDPWGNTYYVTMDTDGDGNCTTSDHQKIIKKSVAVWSWGTGMLKSW